MIRIVAAIALLLCALPAGARTNLIGSWEGTLRVSPSAALRLRVNIAGNPDSPTLTLDSPDQNAFGMPAKAEYIEGDSIALSISQLQLRYAGRLEGDSIRGTFSQGALSHSMSLGRFSPSDSGKSASAAPSRPQTPAAPFPYSEEELKITNPDGGHQLAGTLTVPDKPAPGAPLAVLVSGSGLQNRDEALAGHRPFAVLADQLARRGIAVFRYDDRSVGESGGDIATATTADFASDARAVARRMHADSRFGSVGIVGHSEGGQIACMLGADGTADFAVSIAGPAVRGDSLLAMQNRALLVGGGLPESLADDYTQGLLRLYSILAEGKADAAQASAQAIAQWPADVLHLSLGGNLRKVADAYLAQPWLQWFATHSPASDIASMQVPLLAIYGTKDVQVPAAENSAAIRRLNPRADVREFDGLNHLMQTATTGLPDEYATIEETLSPAVIDAIAAFILAPRK